MSDHQKPGYTDPSVNERAVSRIGMVLFLIYLALYAGFVWINAFRFKWMSIIVVGGVNLAVAYGIGLIFAAIFLSLVYMILCSGRSEKP